MFCHLKHLTTHSSDNKRFIVKVYVFIDDKHISEQTQM